MKKTHILLIFSFLSRADTSLATRAHNTANAQAQAQPTMHGQITMAYLFLLTLDFYIGFYIFSEEYIHLAPYLSCFYGPVEDLNYTNMQIRFPYISGL